MSDTPRSDAAARAGAYFNEGDCSSTCGKQIVHLEDMRILERELNAEKDQAQRLREALEEIRQWGSGNMEQFSRRFFQKILMPNIEEILSLPEGDKKPAIILTNAERAAQAISEQPVVSKERTVESIKAQNEFNIGTLVTDVLHLMENIRPTKIALELKSRCLESLLKLDVDKFIPREDVEPLVRALENFISVGMEFYDMECGEAGGAAINQAEEALQTFTEKHGEI